MEENKGPFSARGKRPRELHVPAEDDVPLDDPKLENDYEPSIMTKILREMEQIKSQLHFGSVASSEDLAERTNELEAENARLAEENQELKKRTAEEGIKTDGEPVASEEMEETIAKENEKPNFVRDRIKKIAYTA